MRVLRPDTLDGMAPWTPRTGADLRRVIADGDLQENNNVDVKREVGDSPSSRKETAKDIASFAINGGALLVGIAEDKENRRWALAPFELAGQVERVEQIAANRIDPPVAVRVTEIPTDADSNLGFLCIEIPFSPDAPHMVDGVYPARGERTTRRMTDAEVARVHVQRGSRESLVESLLLEEIRRDPFAGRSKFGHIHAVGEPRNAPPQLARALVWDAPQEMLGMRDRTEMAMPGRVRSFVPTLGYANHLLQRSAGVALTSLTGDGRTPGEQQEEDQVVDLEILVSGGIRLFNGRLTDLLRGDPPTTVILDGMLIAHAFRLALLAGEVAGHCRYSGVWDLGILGDKLRGNRAYTDNRWGTHNPAYDRDTYSQTTWATTQELSDEPAQVVRRLCEPFLRGLGTWSTYEPLFTGK